MKNTYTLRYKIGLLIGAIMTFVSLACSVLAALNIRESGFMLYVAVSVLSLFVSGLIKAVLDKERALGLDEIGRGKETNTYIS